MESFASKKNIYVARIADYILTNGISDSSLKKMAEAALTSDRMLMHYFKDKSEIVTLALKHINQELINLLNGNSELSLGFSEFLLFICRAINEPKFKPYLNLWFEVVHLSSGNEEPYVSIGKEIGEAYREWIATVYKPGSNENQEGMTSLIFALTEGFVFINKIEMNDKIQLAIEALTNLYTAKEG